MSTTCTADCIHPLATLSPRVSKFHPLTCFCKTCRTCRTLRQFFFSLHPFLTRAKSNFSELKCYRQATPEIEYAARQRLYDMNRNRPGAVPELAMAASMAEPTDTAGNLSSPSSKSGEFESFTDAPQQAGSVSLLSLRFVCARAHVSQHFFFLC